MGRILIPQDEIRQKSSRFSLLKIFRSIADGFFKENYQAVERAEWGQVLGKKLFESFRAGRFEVTYLIHFLAEF